MCVFGWDNRTSVLKTHGLSQNFFQLFWSFSLWFPGNCVIGCREPRNPDIPAHTFHAVQIGGSFQRPGDNSCCHVWAFTVKLRHAEVMSLRSRRRPQIWPQLLCRETIFWMLPINKLEQRGSPEWKITTFFTDSKTSTKVELLTSLLLLQCVYLGPLQTISAQLHALFHL